MKNIFIFFLVSTSITFAQYVKPDYENFAKKVALDSVSVYQMQLKDGSEINCIVTKFDSTTVYFKSVAGLTGSVKFENINKVYLLSGEWLENRFKHFNPHSAHLLLSPTGINLKAGSVYLSFVELFFPMINVAVTDYLTMGLGAPIIPAGRLSTYYFYGKFNALSYKDFYLSGGVFGIVGNGDGYFYPFAVSTYKAERFSITVGGYLGEDNDILPYIGGELSLSRKVQLVTENWVLPNTDYLLYSIAVRYSTETWGSDLGLVKLFEVDSGFPFFPWFGVHFNL